MEKGKSCPSCIPQDALMKAGAACNWAYSIQASLTRHKLQTSSQRSTRGCAALHSPMLVSSQAWCLPGSRPGHEAPP